MFQILADISSTLSLLGRIGCPSLISGDGQSAVQEVTIDATNIAFCEAPYDPVRKMRASVLVLGPLLARKGYAKVSLPGGCAIGNRPVDQHLKGLEAMGCVFEIKSGYIEGRVEHLKGADIFGYAYGWWYREYHDGCSVGRWYHHDSQRSSRT